MLWVRDYTDSDSHPQMLKAGYHGRQIFRFLCRVSGCHELNGKLPDEYVDPAYLVGHVGIRCCAGCPVPTVTHAADGVTSLYAVRLLVRNADGVTEIDGWARKQPRAPKSNAERQRELRARRNEKVTSRNALEERRREEKRGEEETTDPSASPPGAVVGEIFEWWRTTLQHPTAKLDQKRKRTIQAALDLGYSVEQLKIAIAGCASSAWHLGKNEKRRRYDALGLILRDAEHIDQFIGLRMSPAEQQAHFAEESGSG